MVELAKGAGCRVGLTTHLAMQRALGQEFRWDPTGPPRRGESILDQMERGAPLPETCRSCYKSLGGVSALAREVRSQQTVVLAALPEERR